jgi:hypothetical protein
MLCSVVEIYYFRETCCLHVCSAPEMKTACSSEITINFNVTSQKIVVSVVATVRASNLWLKTCWKVWQPTAVAYVSLTYLYSRGIQIPGNRLPGWQFYMVPPYVFGASVWYALHVTLLVPTVLRWLLCFWKIYGPLLCVMFNVLRFVRAGASSIWPTGQVWSLWLQDIACLRLSKTFFTHLPNMYDSKAVGLNQPPAAAVPWLLAVIELKFCYCEKYPYFLHI